MKKERLFRIEFFYKGVYNFKGFREAKKWAEKEQGGEVRQLLCQRYFTIKEMKQGKDEMINMSFTKELEQ